MNMDLRHEIISIARAAQGASRLLVNLSCEAKNAVLKEMAKALLKNRSAIFKANQKDIRRARCAKRPLAFIDRLTLSDKRLQEMSKSLLEIARLPDPVGRVIKAWRRPNGLRINKVRTPIGVVAVIYESRPNVTSDCIGLCFKSANAVILRGGSEALNTNRAVFNALKPALRKYKIPAGAINLVATPARRAVDILLQQREYIDLAMPRGGENLIKRVSRISKVPVIKHYKGICHVYVDADADLNMAQEISFNAKVQRPGVCNAMECLLVHRRLAAKFLPPMIKKFQDAGVQIRGCRATRRLGKNIKLATQKDYRTEYLDLILSVKVVKDMEAAIKHINTYGSHHSDAIVTENRSRGIRFLRQVDSACVYVNASTRFTDGYQFGLGAEIGISTDKLHARGPVALEELTTYKYMVFADGQVRK
jgi:glutamate-5-semialdehyde dehydrogenase